MRRVALGVVGLAVVVPIGGCSMTAPAAVRLHDGELQLAVALCDDEPLEQVWLTDTDAGEVVWSLTATGEGEPIRMVELDAEPDGYVAQGIRSVAELDDGVRYSVGARGLGTPGVTFELADLPSDGRWHLPYDSDPDRSTEALEDDFDEFCHPLAERLSDRFGPPLFGFVVAGAATALVYGRLSRRRTGSYSVQGSTKVDSHRSP